MVTAVLVKTLQDRRRSLIGWSLGVAVSTLLIFALWPTMRDMAGLEQLLESYPAEIGEVFGIQGMTTPAGFLSAEYSSLLGPLLFLTFGIALGSRLPAAEEQRGSLEVLLSTPVTRVRLLAGQALAVVVAVLVLGAVQLASFVVGGLLFDADIAPGRLVAGGAALVLLGVEFGCLALFVGAATGRRGVALSVASGAAVLGYLYYVAARFVDGLESWRSLTPFEQAVGSEPLLNGLAPTAVAALLLPALAFLALALPVFDRRDLATA